MYVPGIKTSTLTRLALFSGQARWTVTRVISKRVDTGDVILAGRQLTLVYVWKQLT